jgi:hypothetical protein
MRGIKEMPKGNFSFHSLEVIIVFIAFLLWKIEFSSMSKLNTEKIIAPNLRRKQIIQISISNFDSISVATNSSRLMRKMA